MLEWTPVLLQVLVILVGAAMMIQTVRSGQQSVSENMALLRVSIEKLSDRVHDLSIGQAAHHERGLATAKDLTELCMRVDEIDQAVVRNDAEARKRIHELWDKINEMALKLATFRSSP